MATILHHAADGISSANNFFLEQHFHLFMHVLLQNRSNLDTKETARLLHLDALVQVTVVLASAAVFGFEKQIRH